MYILSLAESKLLKDTVGCWQNFIRHLMHLHGTHYRSKEESRIIINEELSKYNAHLTYNADRAEFETEEDFVVFKLKFS